MRRIQGCTTCGGTNALVVCSNCTTTLHNRWPADQPYNTWSNPATYIWVKGLDDTSTADQWKANAISAWEVTRLRHRDNHATRAKNRLAKIIEDDLLENERPLEGFAAELFDHYARQVDFQAIADALLSLHVTQYITERHRDTL